MSAQYDDGSNKFESSSVSESQNNSDGSHEEGSDQTLSSDDGAYYEFPSSQPIPMVQPKSPVLPSAPKLKNTTNQTTPAVHNVPVSNQRKSGENNAGASIKPTAIVPKKRRHFDTVPESDSTKETSTLERISVPATENPVAKLSCVLPIEGYRNKPKDVIEKSYKSVKWATDAPPVKKRHQDVKKRPQKAESKDKPPVEKGHRDAKKWPKKVSTPQLINEVPSTTLTGQEKVESVTALPQMDKPRSNKGSSKKSVKKYRFWSDTLASDFDSLDYEVLLKKCQFTEEQTDVLKQSFNLLCRKLYNVSTYTDRFMKTHNCIDCEFSISHQCVSVHFSQYVRSNGNVLGITTITPESMNMCICGFGFFHSHGNRSRMKLSDNLTSINISSLSEHDRSSTVSCRNCLMNIVMKNRNREICSNFTTWTNLEGTVNRQFYKFLGDRLELSDMSKPKITELYTCLRRCCQMFHRCPENAVSHDANLTKLSPITTYTRTLISRSNK